MEILGIFYLNLAQCAITTAIFNYILNDPWEVNKLRLYD